MEDKVSELEDRNFEITLLKERHPEVQGLRKRATVVYDGDDGPRLG